MHTSSSWSCHSCCALLDSPVNLSLTDMWHGLGMDGFFSSVQLFRDLYEQKGILAVATTRQWVTGFPQTPLLTSKKLKAGQFIARQQTLSRDEALTCVSWVDRKAVNLLTTTVNHSRCPHEPGGVRHAVQTTRASTAHCRAHRCLSPTCSACVVRTCTHSASHMHVSVAKPTAG